MLTEYAALDYGGESGSDNDARKHGLVEVADDLFQREGHSGDRRIEGGGNAGGDSNRSHTALVLPREFAELAEHAW